MIGLIHSVMYEIEPDRNRVLRSKIASCKCTSQRYPTMYKENPAIDDNSRDSGLLVQASCALCINNIYTI